MSNTLKLAAALGLVAIIGACARAEPEPVVMETPMVAPEPVSTKF